MLPTEDGHKISGSYTSCVTSRVLRRTLVLEAQMTTQLWEQGVG
jgi:hypothetical protein